MALVVLLSVGLGWFGWKFREVERRTIRRQATSSRASILAEPVVSGGCSSLDPLQAIYRTTLAKLGQYSGDLSGYFLSSKGRKMV